MEIDFGGYLPLTETLLFSLPAIKIHFKLGNAICQTKANRISSTTATVTINNTHLHSKHNSAHHDSFNMGISIRLSSAGNKMVEGH
jgi:hypothetical protein